MAGSYKNRTISTDFAVFLNTFLIISTVIVFAVLVFISYQNMSNKFLHERFTLATDACTDVASDYLRITNRYEDPGTAAELMDIYLRSNALQESGSVFIADGAGNIYFSNEISPNADVALALSWVTGYTGSGLFQQVNEITGTFSQIVTACRIGETGLYSVVITDVDYAEMIREYMTVVFYPVMVAFVAAIALFIGFTGLTIRPLRDISRTVSQVADGDLTARVDDKYTQTGDSTGMLTLSSDLTDMARNVNNMIEVLENQEKDRAVFISSVAHDIRTPLTSINGFVTAMTDGTIPPELYEKYLLRIKAEADKIKNLVVSMTEASSLSHIETELMEVFDLKSALEDLLYELEPQFKAKDITCETRIDEEGGTYVYGEAQLLCRVLLNIVTNAIKFTPEGGKIIISSSLEDKTKRLITVEDSGPGVEPDKRNRVFESFYKVDSSRKQEGFGLGLYICKQILTGHGQNIRLEESRELGGALFIFTFPTPGSKD